LSKQRLIITAGFSARTEPCYKSRTEITARRLPFLICICFVKTIIGFRLVNVLQKKACPFPDRLLQVSLK
jgi:hypothetical protein